MGKKRLKTNLFGLFKKNELDSILKSARRRDSKRFLIAWNRGLGDIPLGLYALIIRIREYIPDARITFITRKELEEAFCLLKDTAVISAEWWERGKAINLAETLERLGIDRRDYDVVLEHVNPTKWLSWQIGQVMPRLNWKDDYDNLWRRFDLDEPFEYIGVHFNTETGQFYGYKKDWHSDKWKELFIRLSEREGRRIILFGANKSGSYGIPNIPNIIDIRGETGLLEMLSIIKNRCGALIAPDGGVLSMTYYLDVFFPITIISLWGDAKQGIMKQAVASPNRGLIHKPIIGRKKDISNINVDEVIERMPKNI
ncbi:MAG: hypothetical protein L0Y62_05725 [Nitrospirae bacterium]|nr:hypothetical protein [Nitrospirota bacterium]